MQDQIEPNVINSLDLLEAEYLVK